MNTSQLSGSDPSEFGRLVERDWLDLRGSPDLSGPLPGNLTALRQLRVLYGRDTELCAPQGAVFQSWPQSVQAAHIRPWMTGLRLGSDVGVLMGMFAKAISWETVEARTRPRMTSRSVFDVRTGLR